MKKVCLSLIVLLGVAMVLEARPPRITSTTRTAASSQCVNGVCTVQSSSTTDVKVRGDAAFDALNLVNQQRAAMGLKPFIRDEALTAAAMSLSVHRAQHRIAGHTRNDFQFLPPGSNATASGCCYTPRSDWGACCTDDRKATHAGAAVAVVNGRWFCSIFVR